MKILLLRTKYRKYYTQGIMLIDDVFFGYTLEDEIRLTPKVRKMTAIPEGFYQVVVDYSPRFKRDLPRIKGVNKFKGIRIHGGNTHKNTEGCPLIAKNKGDGKIWGSLSAKLTNKLKRATDDIYIEIINTREW